MCVYIYIHAKVQIYRFTDARVFVCRPASGIAGQGVALAPYTFNICVCLRVNVYHHVSVYRFVVCRLQVLQDKEFSIRDEIKLNQQVNQQRSVHGSFLQLYL